MSFYAPYEAFPWWVDSQVLKAKALEVRDALLESLLSKARDQNNHIISRYESILSRIAEKPANEADLAALRVFIADSKEKVRWYTDVHDVAQRHPKHSKLSFGFVTVGAWRMWWDLRGYVLTFCRHFIEWPSALS